MTNLSRFAPFLGDKLPPLLLLLLLFILNNSRLSHGGTCWLNQNGNGRCTNLLKTWSSSKEDCCNSGMSSVAWSDEDMDPSTFFYMHLQGGAPCSKCKESCEGVECPKGYACAMRRNGPKCICRPNCSGYRKSLGKLKHKKGAVCGSDGVTYKSTCRLLKRSCRKKIPLSIAYYGPCKVSCSKIKCPESKICILDQNMIPHCIQYSNKKCNRGVEMKYFFSRFDMGFANNVSKSRGNEICGVDGITYRSICKLREAALQRGKAIEVAYIGRCQQRPTCSSIHCARDQSCLIEPESGNARCVTCEKWCPDLSFLPLNFTQTTSGTLSRRRRLKRLNSNGPICSNIGKTFPSYCEMIKEGCSTGVALETLYFGKCHSKN